MVGNVNRKEYKGYTIEKTSERTFYILTPEGDEVYVWADPHSKYLKCSCQVGTMEAKHHLCSHIALVKKLFNHKVNRNG